MMDGAHTHPAVAYYLQELDGAAAAAGLGQERRTELRAEIAAHVEAALGADPHAPDAAVADVLDRLGAVGDIVAAEVSDRPEGAGPRSAGPPVGARGAVGGIPTGPGDAVRGSAVLDRGAWGALEYVALGLLTLGQVLLPVVGPLAGVICAWSSRCWSVGGKIAATALGLAVPVTVFLAAGLLFAGGESSAVPSPVISAVPVPSPALLSSPEGTGPSEGLGPSRTRHSGSATPG